jgi:predicted permease
MASRSPADRLCDLVVRAYPAEFRARFGNAMAETIASDLAAARARGRAAAIRFVTLTVIDSVRFGAAERCRPRPFLPAALAAEGVTVKSLLTTDVRDAWRSLRATPVVTAIAVLSLALGIGANTALFSILNTLVLKQLPVREPARLALLDGDEWTNPIWEEIRSRDTQIADGAFAWSGTRFDLAESGDADMVDGAWVSGRMFEILGIPAVRGRTISPADDVRGGGPDGAVAIISYRLWQRRFGGSESVIGQEIFVERVPFTIVGVMLDGFSGPEVGRGMDVAVPIGAEPLARGKESMLDGRSTWWLNVAFRMKQGDTLDTLTGRLRGVQPQIRAATVPLDWPAAEQAQYLKDPFILSPAATGISPLRQRYVEPLTVILAVVGLVLLIACANIASLLLARAAARRHEFSVRLALGASRFRLSRQLLAESMMMAGIGAALGLAFAQWSSRLLVGQLTAMDRQVTMDLTMDWRVLAFTVAVTAATVVLFGLAPVFGISTVAPQNALKEQGRGVSGDRRLAFRHALVVIQVALSLTLVVGALLFARTFTALVTREAGFDRDHVLVVNVNTARTGVTTEMRPALFEQLRQTAGSLPGVAAAAASFTSPTGSAGWNMGVRVPPDSPLGRRERMTWMNAVTPDWFRAYGMRLTAGRDFGANDTATSPLAAIVNQTFARRFLRAGNPVGQHFERDGPFGKPSAFEVVGLVEDAVYRSIRAEMSPIVYIPISQWGNPSPSVVISVRSANGSPAALARSVSAALTGIDRRLSLSSHTLKSQVDAALIQERLLANMSVFFGSLALLLAGLGLYGVTSYTVNNRRTEIGIRMALGANAAGVVRLVLSRVAWLVGLGVAAGIALSLWASRFVSALLYGLEATDRLTLVAAGALLVCVGMLAGWLPARRAARTDPTVVLRQS